MPDAAMILAAGLGTRMRPITDQLPKPLVPVDGKPLIDYALDSVQSTGIEHIVINVHHMAEKVVDHLSRRSGPKMTISDETNELLNSGGGIVNALPTLGKNPFMILNADTFWLEDHRVARTNLELLAAAWDIDAMDILLMTTKLDQIVGYEGRGDFLSDQNGRLRRFDGGSDAPLVYPGVAIINPAIFDKAPRRAFSLNICFDQAIACGRLHGVPADGLWLTVGTPQAVEEAETAMNSYRSATMQIPGVRS
jgi:MurNAc alpha-1-phosphate uridylyltransferase